MKPQIFASPNEITHFVRLLLRNTIKNHDILRWNRDAAIRDTVCQAAYKHGMLARKAAGGRRLTARIIEASLKRAKKDCPAGAGGGIMCVD
jgi:hypothetical protein